MKKSEQWALPHHKSTGRSEPLSNSLPHQRSMVKRGNSDSETNSINLRTVSSAAPNTTLCYEDVSVDYSRYYKESPITFEDLLSDESYTSNISSVSEEEGYVEEPGAVHQTRSNYEDGNTLRAVTYHKYRILQLCFTSWWRIVVIKRQRAIQFHHRYLLRQGWKTLRWNMMIGQEFAKMGIWHHQKWKHRRVFLKWKASTLMSRHRRLRDAFCLWRRLTKLKISCCVSRLVAQRKVVQTCWTQWKLTLLLIRQKRVAFKHFRIILLRKSFTAFLINANMIKQKQLANDLSEAFHSSVIKRYCFTHWKLTLHNTLTTRRHYECVLLLRMLRKWHDNTVSSRCRCQQLEGLAEKHCCKYSLRHFFSHWHVQLLERKALKFRRVLLLSRYAHLWNSRQRIIQHNRVAAESLYTKVAIKVAFSQWKMKCVKVQRTRVNMKSLLQKEILQRYFDGWRNAVNFSNSLRTVQVEFMRQCNVKTLALYYTCWRKRFAVVKHNHAADNRFQLHLKRRAFATWRLFIYQQTLRHASKLFIIERKRNLLQRYFDQWVCETACIVGENVISTRLFSALDTYRLRKAFLIWQKAARTSQAATRLQRTCMKKFFCKWQQRWRAQCMGTSALAHSAEVLVVKKWFKKWKTRLHSQVLTKTADKHYTSVLLKKAYCFITMEYRRHQAATQFFCSVQQSSLVTCFMRWKAVLFTRRQLEGMKRSVKFQQHHLIGKCFTAWLKFTRTRWQQLNINVDHFNMVLTNKRQLTAWRTWKRQLLCHHIMRDRLKRKRFGCMQRCFCHWRTITEQSLQSLSATFIAKFHVSALFAGGNTTTRQSHFNDVLFPHQNIPKTVSQYQMSVLSSKSSAIKNNFIDIPTHQSTPLLPLHNERTRSSSSNEASHLQIERDVKRQLFSDSVEECSQSLKRSPPCHCLNPEVASQLTNLQQDLDNSINKLESNLSQGSGCLITSNEIVLSSHSDNIISPPMEFSEQCNLPPISPVPSIKTVSTISTQMSIQSDINVVSLCCSNEVTVDHSYLLFSKLLSIVKLMQHYPVSAAFVAWRRFVQRRKSLAMLRTNLHYRINYNIVTNTFKLWKLSTHKVLKYKQFEISFLASSQKRILTIALQKWITVYRKRLKDTNILSGLLVLRNQLVVKKLFHKWKCNFEITIRIRNHMANGLMLRCLQSWRDYSTSKRMVKAKMECVQTKLKQAALLRCLTQWSNEVRRSRLLRVCLHHWSHYTQDKVQLRLVSVAFEERRRALWKQRMFLEWKRLTNSIVAVQKLHHQNVLKSTFVTWENLTVRKREELFYQQQEKDGRMLTITLVHWRKITRETRLAKGMKGSYHEFIFEEEGFFEISKSKFPSKITCHTNCLRLLHCGWKKWRYRIIQERVSLRIAAVDNMHLMKKVFNAWRRVTLTAADDYSMPVVVDEEDTTVLNLFFKQWKIKYMQKNCKMR